MEQPGARWRLGSRVCGHSLTPPLQSEYNFLALKSLKVFRLEDPKGPFES